MLSVVSGEQGVSWPQAISWNSPGLGVYANLGTLWLMPLSIHQALVEIGAKVTKKIAAAQAANVKSDELTRAEEKERERENDPSWNSKAMKLVHKTRVQRQIYSSCPSFSIPTKHFSTPTPPKSMIPRCCFVAVQVHLGFMSLLTVFVEGNEAFKQDHSKGFGRCVPGFVREIKELGQSKATPIRESIQNINMLVYNQKNINCQDLYREIHHHCRMI